MPEPKIKVEVELTLDEHEALKKLCAQKELSTTALIRQALRLYQLHSVRASGELPELPPKRCPDWPNFRQ
jgi:hypothetical protein